MRHVRDNTNLVEKMSKLETPLITYDEARRKAATRATTMYLLFLGGLYLADNSLPALFCYPPWKKSNRLSNRLKMFNSSVWLVTRGAELFLL